MSEATNKKLNEKLNKEKVDFDVEEVICDMLHEERCNRYAAETKIYFLLKDLINTLNRYATSPLHALKVIASGYKRTRMHFQIVLYSADKWKIEIIEGLGKYIENNWKSELNAQKLCEFSPIEIVKNMIYMTLFEIESNHIIETDINFFYHN